jgi:flagellar biosynthesis activator protein FlaF
VYNSALNAYQDVQKKTMSGRDTEARVLTQAAFKLIECQRRWADADHQIRLGEALKYNQRVWTIFHLEVQRADNPLPENLKRNIVRLSYFIDKQALDILSNPEPHKLDIIIKINQNIAAGLRGSSGDEAYAEDMD